MKHRARGMEGGLLWPVVPKGGPRETEPGMSRPLACKGERPNNKKNKKPLNKS